MLILKQKLLPLAATYEDLNNTFNLKNLQRSDRSSSKTSNKMKTRD